MQIYKMTCSTWAEKLAKHVRLKQQPKTHLPSMCLLLTRDEGKVRLWLVLNNRRVIACPTKRTCSENHTSVHGVLKHLIDKVHTGHRRRSQPVVAAMRRERVSFQVQPHLIACTILSITKIYQWPRNNLCVSPERGDLPFYRNLASSVSHNRCRARSFFFFSIFPCHIA